MKEIVHDPGCGVLLVRAVFLDTYKIKLSQVLGDLASGSHSTGGKDPDGLKSCGGRYSEQRMPLDVGAARHSE